MQDNCILIVQDIKFTLPIEEAIAIRDSLCARLGCPTFCCGSDSTTNNIDNTITTQGVIELVTKDD